MLRVLAEAGDADSRHRRWLRHITGDHSARTYTWEAVTGSRSQRRNCKEKREKYSLFNHNKHPLIADSVNFVTNVSKLWFPRTNGVHRNFTSTPHVFNHLNSVVDGPGNLRPGLQHFVNDFVLDDVIGSEISA